MSPAIKKRESVRGVLLATLAVAVAALLAWGGPIWPHTNEASLAGDARNSAPRSSKAEKGHPDRFQQMQALIRTAEGETTQGYAPSYRIAAYRAAQVARKTSRGPLPWEERGPSNVGGRTRAIVVDARDTSGDTWLAGSVGGGIWRTTTAGQDWEPLTDDWPTLSISSLVQAPSNPDVLYAGTGEGFFNVDAIIGTGIFKSLDGGLTWAQLTSTFALADFNFVNRLIVDPDNENILVAATNTGLFRTADGGASFSLVADPGGRVAQVIYEPGNFRNQYAAVTGVGVWKSVDAGRTWSASSGGLSIEPGARIELGVSPVQPGRVIAMAEVSDGPETIHVSDNRGALWGELTQNSTTDMARDQGWYDMAVTPHPFNADVVFVGGVNMHRLTLAGETTFFSADVGENGTRSFLTKVNFGGEFWQGGMRLGTADDEAVIAPEDMVSAEIRFGPGRSQKAHRFTPPDGPGIPFSSYPFADYVDVPFEVWDVENNRQLHVSFRDRLGDGAFNLIPRDDNNLGREYILIHARTYTPNAPDPQISSSGGLIQDLMYFIWPMLEDEAAWTPENLPESSLRFTLSRGTGPAAFNESQIGAAVHVDHHILLPHITDAGNEAFELISGNDGGVWHSPDGGSSWNERSRFYNTSQFYGVDKKPGAQIYVGGMQDNGTFRSFAPFMGNVPGWTPAIGGDGFDAVWHQENDTWLMGGFQFNGFQRSLDGGVNWSSATSGLTDTGESPNAPFINSLERNAFDSDILFAIGGSGVWKSTDFGGSWKLRPIPASDWGFRASARGVVRPSLASGDVVWAGYEMDPQDNGQGDVLGQIHLSTDGGETFLATIPSPLSPAPISGLATHPTDPATAYVLFSASNRPKILRTTDFGQTWEDLSGFEEGSTGILSARGFPDVAVYDLLVIPDFPHILWAGTEIGLFVSEDDGTSWQLTDSGLPAASIWRMKVIDNEIVMATHGRGVWIVPVGAVTPISTDVAERDETLPRRLALTGVYPNPLDGQATITFDLPESGHVRLEAVDITGRHVALLEDAFRSAGRHEVFWRAAPIAAGTYFIRITTASGSDARAVVKAGRP